MESLVLIGLIVVLYGAAWTLSDLLRDCGFNPARLTGRTAPVAERTSQRLDQACSALRSRDISSSTACRAGLSR